MFKKILTFFALIIGLSNVAIAAEDPIYTSLFNNKALNGYDTVAYFTMNKAVKGNKDIKTEYKSAEWHFSTQEHLEMFLENPEKYAPQYGGYCAFALGFKGSLVSTDPGAWHITNNKLYLNYNEKVQERWMEERDELIIDADKVWPSVLEE